LGERTFELSSESSKLAESWGDGFDCRRKKRRSQKDDELERWARGEEVEREERRELTKYTRPLNQDRQDDQPFSSDVSTELIVEEDHCKLGAKREDEEDMSVELANQRERA